MKPHPGSGLLPALFVLLASGHDLPAASASWNLNGDGLWSSHGNWFPAAAPGVTSGTINTDTATFGNAISAARAVTVDADRNVSGISFAGNSSAYTLAGGSLLFTSGGTIQTLGGGSAHTDVILSPITLTNTSGDVSGTLAITAGSTTSARLLSISGPISGSATSGSSVLTLGGTNSGNNTLGGAVSDGGAGGNLAIIKTGTGNWILSGSSSFSGGLAVRAGQLRLASPGGASSPGTGPITLGDTSGSSNATLRVDNSFSPSNPLTVASGSTGVKTLDAGSVASPGFTGPITLNDALSIAVTTTGATHTSYSFSGPSAIQLNSHVLTLRLAQGSSGNTNNATISLAKPIIGSGGITIVGGGASTGTRTVHLTGTNSHTGDTTVGGSGTSQALVVNVSGNQAAATGGWSIDTGNDSTTNKGGNIPSTVNFSAGSTATVGSGRAVVLGGTQGHFGARTLNAAGAFTNDGSLQVRRSSTVNVTGTWVQNGSATVATQGGGEAALAIAAGGTFTYASSTDFALNTSTSENVLTHLGITGGTLHTGTAIRNHTVAAVATNFAQIILDDGGTIRLSAGVPQLLTTAGAHIRLLLGETGSGGFIDTNGFDTAISQPVGNVSGQSGKLTKLGGGTLTLEGAVSHGGNTTVTAGTLSIRSPSLADASKVTVASGALLHLDFTGVDTIGSLILGGTTYTSGTFSALSPPGSGFLTGGGILQITTADPFAVWIDSFYPGETNAAVIGRDADPDGDGVPNGIEYLTGGEPDQPADKGLLWVGRSGGKLVLSLAIRGAATAFSGSPSPSATVDGFTATIQGSTDLAAFTSPVSITTFSLPPGWSPGPPSGFGYHTFQLDASVGLTGRGFIRLKAE